MSDIKVVLLIICVLLFAVPLIENTADYWIRVFTEDKHSEEAREGK